MTLQEKYIEALEKLNTALENKITFLTSQMTLMNQETLALRESNSHYERVVAAFEDEKVDNRNAINELKRQLRESRHE